MRKEQSKKLKSGWERRKGRQHSGKRQKTKERNGEEKTINMRTSRRRGV
jgi:hypothetical protein